MDWKESVEAIGRYAAEQNVEEWIRAVRRVSVYDPNDKNPLTVPGPMFDRLLTRLAAQDGNLGAECGRLDVNRLTVREREVVRG